MAVAKRKARGSGTPTDGATWAAGRTYRWRTCETCRWGRFHADGLRFINDALKQREQGASFSFTDLTLEVRKRFGYPLTDGALRLHYTRGCK